MADNSGVQLQTDVDELKADVRELKADVNRIETKVDRHETRIEALHPIRPSRCGAAASRPSGFDFVESVAFSPSGRAALGYTRQLARDQRQAELDG